MTEYCVSVSCNFTASDPTDAVKQMVAWLDDNACAAGYRVSDFQFGAPGGLYIDAATIDFNAITFDDEPENVPCRVCGRIDLPLHVNHLCPECFHCPEVGVRGTRCIKVDGHYDDCEFAPSPNPNNNPGGTNP